MTSILVLNGHPNPLGTWFSSNTAEASLLNMNEKMTIIKKILNSWSPRGLLYREI